MVLYVCSNITVVIAYSSESLLNLYINPKDIKT